MTSYRLYQRRQKRQQGNIWSLKFRCRTALNLKKMCQLHERRETLLYRVPQSRYIINYRLVLLYKKVTFEIYQLEIFPDDFRNRPRFTSPCITTSDDSPILLQSNCLISNLCRQFRILRKARRIRLIFILAVWLILVSKRSGTYIYCFIFNVHICTCVFVLNIHCGRVTVRKRVRN